jgi:hypothetical protein
MTINLHKLGATVRISVAFEDANGDAADPTTVTLKVQDPSGNEDTYAYADSPTVIYKSATGNYYADIVADESGDWFYRWEGTGGPEGVDEEQFMVEASQF